MTKPSHHRDADLTIRPAHPGEAAALSTLCLASKGAWGYDTAFLEACRNALTVTEADIAAGRIVVAAGEGDRPLALYRLDLEGDIADLALFFVAPEAMRRGVGRHLFRHLLQDARRQGCRRLTILADPNAAGFYESEGAVLVEERPSDVFPDRRLPFYELSLDAAA